MGEIMKMERIGKIGVTHQSKQSTLWNRCGENSKEFDVPGRPGCLGQPGAELGGIPMGAMFGRNSQEGRKSRGGEGGGGFPKHLPRDEQNLETQILET